MLFYNFLLAFGTDSSSSDDDTTQAQGPAAVPSEYKDLVKSIQKSQKRKPIPDRKREKEGVPLRKSDEKDEATTSVEKREFTPRLGSYTIK